MTAENHKSKALKPARIAGVVMAVGTGWVFFEWLFFVTKPSFMSLYSLWEKFGVLSSTALIVSLSLLLATLPFDAPRGQTDNFFPGGVPARIAAIGHGHAGCHRQLQPDAVWLGHP
jgi:hypothetical protein